jgi:UDP-3-O-[3-hydroxymyristoyl] glucosamine N-acyltransferase
VPARLGALAVRYGCELRGDPELLVDRVASLSQATPGAIAFLANSAYRSQLMQTGASAVILAAEDAANCPVAALISPEPYLMFARIATELHPAPPIRPGVSGAAHVHAGTRIPESCEVQPGAVIEEGAVLGERVRIGANAVIGPAVRIGDDTRIMAGAVLYREVRVGRRCLVHAGAVIGADGFGMARDAAGGWVKIPQLGTVVLGDDVEVGANTTIDRGAIGDTEIGDGVKLDNQIQIGHNCVIGRHTAIAAMVGIAGSTRVGERCMIGGQVGIVGHLRIADDVTIAAAASVITSLEKAGVYGGAIPAQELPRWRRNAIRFGQLDELAKAVRKLGKRAPDAVDGKPGDET